MKLLSKEDRKNPMLIIKVVMATINTYGQAQLDCGHLVYNAQIIMAEDEDGQFITMCSACGELNDTA